MSTSNGLRQRKQHLNPMAIQLCSFNGKNVEILLKDLHLIGLL